MKMARIWYRLFGTIIAGADNSLCLWRAATLCVHRFSIIHDGLVSWRAGHWSLRLRGRALITARQMAPLAWAPDADRPLRTHSARP